MSVTLTQRLWDPSRLEDALAWLRARREGEEDPCRKGKTRRPATLHRPLPTNLAGEAESVTGSETLAVAVILPLLVEFHVHALRLRAKCSYRVTGRRHGQQKRNS